MVKLASRVSQGGEMLEALYESYFIMGRNIGDRSVLIDIGTKLGYDSTEVKKYLFSDKDIVETLNQNQSTLRLGISGIPAFIFDDKFSISGAQDNKVLFRMLNIAEDNFDDNTIPNIQPYLKGKQDCNDL
jgi:protein disulfide-isomerase